MNGKSSNEWTGSCLKETNYMQLEECVNERKHTQEMKVGQTVLGNLDDTSESK